MGLTRGNLEHGETLVTKQSGRMPIGGSAVVGTSLEMAIYYEAALRGFFDIANGLRLITGAPAVTSGNALGLELISNIDARLHVWTVMLANCPQECHEAQPLNHCHYHSTYAATPLRISEHSGQQIQPWRTTGYFRCRIGPLFMSFFPV